MKITLTKEEVERLCEVVSNLPIQQIEQGHWDDDAYRENVLEVFRSFFDPLYNLDKTEGDEDNA
tara:strand:- start:39 stop:230 length:192 start_codon:yes stop_codon:yes gene_type:complete